MNELMRGKGRADRRNRPVLRTLSVEKMKVQLTGNGAIAKYSAKPVQTE